MQQQGTTGGRSDVPSVFMAINCGLWLVYGALKADVTLILVNGFGLTAAVYYISIFWTLTKGEAKVIFLFFASCMR